MSAEDLAGAKEVRGTRLRSRFRDDNYRAFKTTLLILLKFTLINGYDSLLVRALTLLRGE